MNACLLVMPYLLTCELYNLRGLCVMSLQLYIGFEVGDSTREFAHAVMLPKL